MIIIRFKLRSKDKIYERTFDEFKIARIFLIRRKNSLSIEMLSIECDDNEQKEMLKSICKGN